MDVFQTPHQGCMPDSPGMVQASAGNGRGVACYPPERRSGKTSGPRTGQTAKTVLGLERPSRPGIADFLPQSCGAGRELFSPREVLRSPDPLPTSTVVGKAEYLLWFAHVYASLLRWFLGKFFPMPEKGRYWPDTSFESVLHGIAGMFSFFEFYVCFSKQILLTARS